MRRKKVIDLWTAGAVVIHDLLPKTTMPRAYITDHVVMAADDLNAGRVAAIAVAGGKIQLLVDEPLNGCLVLEAATIGLQEGTLNFSPHPSTVQGHGQGATRS